MSVSLDRPNLFSSLSKSTSIPSDMYSLRECLMTATHLEQIPKTVIFCLSKGFCCLHFLLKTASPCNGHLSYASLTEHSRSVHQDRFSDCLSLITLHVSDIHIMSPFLALPPICGTPYSQNNASILSNSTFTFTMRGIGILWGT